MKTLISPRALLLPLVLACTPVHASALSSGSGSPSATAPSAAFADVTVPLEIVVARDVTRVAAAKRLARLHAESGNWDEALRVLERSAPHARKDAEYQGFAGTVLRRLKRLPEAGEAYRRAIALQPDEGRWWIGLGLTLEDSGRYKEAKQAFIAAQEREQTLPPALKKLAEKRGR
ncbi:MAG: tetratricopeptide repeat protein [Rhodocyclaceae bacterium]